MHSIRRFVSSIRFRMLVLYIAIILIAFISTLSMSVRIMENSLIKENVSVRQHELNTLVFQLTRSIEAANTNVTYDIISKYAQTVNGRVLVLDTDYVVQVDSAALYNGYYLPYDEAVAVLDGARSSTYGFHKHLNHQSDKSEWIAYYAQPLSANGMNRGVLLLAVSIDSVANAIDALQMRIVVLFAIGIVATTAVWTMVTRWITKPVVQLTDVMRNATAKTFGSRVEIKAGGEVAQLVDAFNRMGSELSAHDRIRDQFVADASHELKTPLASIKALAESVVYCDNPPPELMLDFLIDINNQVDRLNNIVHDLLQVARDSSKDVEYDMTNLDFSATVRELVKFIRPVAEKKGLRLVLEVENDVEIFGDKSRMERVVTNLIDNAIKYTETGSIHVRLRRERREAVFSVKDTGIGIPQESISNLFIRFYRVDKARSRATGGTGLGLSMVEEIVARHGGNIKVESTLGVGSEFIVRIPLQK